MQVNVYIVNNILKLYYPIQRCEICFILDMLKMKITIGILLVALFTIQSVAQLITEFKKEKNLEKAWIQLAICQPTSGKNQGEISFLQAAFGFLCRTI